MMQEMYDWYMDNLFPEHRRQAIRHAEKDGRDRRKRIAKGGAGQARAPVRSNGVSSWEDRMTRLQQGQWTYNPDKSRSKWERIGSPFVASVVDWALIINPYIPPKTKWQSISRQWDRFHEYSN